MNADGEGAGWPAVLQADGALLVVHMKAPLDAAAVQQVCERLRAVLPVDPTWVVVCHVHGAPDVTVVSALARLGLLCRRLDVAVRIRSTGTSPAALEELLELTGLADLVPARLQPVGQSEAPEQGRVEEVVDVGDAAT